MTVDEGVGGAPAGIVVVRFVWLVKYVGEGVVSNTIGVVVLMIGMDNVYGLASMRSTTSDLGGNIGSGGFRGGRTPRGPGSMSQFPFRMASMKVLKLAIFSDGTSVAVTWLDLWKQFSKQ